MQQWPALHANAHNTLASDTLDSPWVYVGTVGGLPDIDGFLALNPYPYGPGDPIGPPPFQNGWNNLATIGVDALVSFCLTTEGWTYIRGAFIGGDPGTVVFTLPAPFAPILRQPFSAATTPDAPGTWAGVIGADGSVTYLTGATF